MSFPLLGCEIVWEEQKDGNWKQIIYGKLVDRGTSNAYERWIDKETSVTKEEYFRRKLAGLGHGKIIKW